MFPRPVGWPAPLLPALVFHQRIAGMYDSVKHLGLVCGPGVGDPQQETLSAWTDILKINYWPIFAIARDILDTAACRPYASLILATNSEIPPQEIGHSRREQSHTTSPDPDIPDASSPTASTWPPRFTTLATASAAGVGPTMP